MKVFALIFMLWVHFDPCKWEDELYLKCTREFLIKEKLLIGTKEIYLNFSQEPSRDLTRVKEFLIDSRVIRINFSKKEGPFYIKFDRPKPDTDSTYFVNFTARTLSGARYFGEFWFKCKKINYIIRGCHV